MHRFRYKAEENNCNVSNNMKWEIVMLERE